MLPAVYCLCHDESEANTILTHLRNAGFSREISVLLQDRSDTKDISLKENVFRGAGVGGVVGALLALAIPGIGAALAVGPIVAALGGAAAGGVVGGLAGGSGAFRPLGLSHDVSSRLHHRVSEGDILIAVHSHDSSKLQMATQIFKSEGAEEIYRTEVAA
jgi:outer membrane lipoprotein SlyB